MNRMFFRGVTTIVALAMGTQTLQAQGSGTADATDTVRVAVTDGPYVMWLGDTAATVLAVCSDRVVRQTARPTKGLLRVANPCAPKEEEIVSEAAAPVADLATFTGVHRLFVASDVEGEYDTFVTLLRNAGVVDKDRHWKWGMGHLVLVGDMVDRGTHVTEVLWLIHRLERESLAAGGRVHYVLGNHDAMLLYGDHRYVARKYRAVAERLGASLLDLFGPTTELGRWMRSKPVMVRIDSTLFTHGGIAPVFAGRGFSLDSVNAIARAGLAKPENRKTDSLAAFVLGSMGPLWYRGYFSRDSTLAPSDLATALAHFGGNKIVVGHTVVDSIQQKQSGRVIAMDVTFTVGDRVQGLLIENGRYTRVTVGGTRTELWKD